MNEAGNRVGSNSRGPSRYILNRSELKLALTKLMAGCVFKKKKKKVLSRTFFTLTASSALLAIHQTEKPPAIHLYVIYTLVSVEVIGTVPGKYTRGYKRPNKNMGKNAFPRLFFEHSRKHDF